MFKHSQKFLTQVPFTFKKHPVMFNDLVCDPENLYKMKKLFSEDDVEEYGDGFGELED